MELQQDARGQTTFYHVLEWGLAIAQSQAVGLLFDYATQTEFGPAQRTRIQLLLPPEHAKQLSEALARTAAEAERRLAEKR